MDFLLEEDAERLTKYYCSRCDIEWCNGANDEFHREFCPYYRNIAKMSREKKFEKKLKNQIDAKLNYENYVRE